MDKNAIAYSIYCDYLGKKNSLLNAVSVAKASGTMLEESEKLYELIEIAKLYAFAGFAPFSCDISKKEIYIENVNNKTQLTLDLDKLYSQKDAVTSLFTAISYLPKYITKEEPLRAVMSDLTELYSEGKEFEDLIFKLNSKIDKELLKNIIAKISKFLDKNFNKEEYSKEDKNYINVIYSEVSEDLDELINK